MLYEYAISVCDCDYSVLRPMSSTVVLRALQRAGMK